MAESYGEEYSKIYDLFYGEKNYRAEVDFIENQVRAAFPQLSPRILELACGTGKHLSELVKRGFSLFGLDCSPGMLKQAKLRLEIEGLQAPLFCQDMAKLEIKDEKFQVVVCLFDALGYVCTNEALIETLTRIHQHLDSDGMLIFDFWHAAAMVRGYERCRVREVNLEETKILRIAETHIEAKTQLAQVKYTFVETTKEATRSWEEIHKNRFFGVAEMDLFLKMSGFTARDFYPGFQLINQITSEDWHVVAIARR